MRFFRYSLSVVTCVAILVATAGQVQASISIIFDNGPVDPTRTTWNDTDPSFTIYDDFILTASTTITELRWSVFMKLPGDYSQTFISIYDGITASAN